MDNDSVHIQSDTEVNTQTRNNKEQIRLFGKNILKSELVFYIQNIILYLVIISCILNLSFNHTDNKLNEVWKSILWYSLGRILPIKNNEIMGKTSTKNIL